MDEIHLAFVVMQLTEEGYANSFPVEIENKQKEIIETLFICCSV